MAEKKKPAVKPKATAKKTVSKKAVAKTVKKTVQKKPAVKPKTAPKRTGRPSKYDDKIAAKICAYLAMGESMRKVCARPGMPAMSTVFVWLREHEEFAEQYARAKEEAADLMIEEILDIADDGANDYMEKVNKKGEVVGWIVNGEAIQRSRVRIDTRKWLASKLKPKKYGDKISVDAKNEHSGKLEHKHAYEEMSEEQLKQIAAQYAKGRSSGSNG